MRTAEGRAHLAISIAAVAVFAWGFGPLLVRGIDASAPTIVFWRLWISAPVMLVAAYFTGGRVSTPLLRSVFVPGVLFGISMLVGFTSYQETSIANATSDWSAPTRSDAVHRADAVRRPLRRATDTLRCDRARRNQHGRPRSQGFVGRIPARRCAGTDQPRTVHGLLRSVKQVRNQGVHSAALLAGVFCVAAVVVSPWVLLTSHDVGGVHGADWLSIVTMVLVSGLVGHGLMTWAQRHLDITLASLLMLGSPVVSAVGAWLVFTQELSALQIAGALVVLAALGAIVLDVRSYAVPADIPLSVSAGD